MKSNAKGSVEIEKDKRSVRQAKGEDIQQRLRSAEPDRSHDIFHHTLRDSRVLFRDKQRRNAGFCGAGELQKALHHGGVQASGAQHIGVYADISTAGSGDTDAAGCGNGAEHSGTERFQDIFPQSAYGTHSVGSTCMAGHLPQSRHAQSVYGDLRDQRRGLVEVIIRTHSDYTNVFVEKYRI